jgi:hypothetical protein
MDGTHHPAAASPACLKVLGGLVLLGLLCYRFEDIISDVRLETRALLALGKY